MAGHSAAFLLYLRKLDLLKLNLMLKAPIEIFWDALWLGVRPFLYFTRRKIDFLKFDPTSKAPIESFWDALWLGIQRFMFHQ